MISGLLSIRRGAGDGLSGEWAIGSCEDEFQGIDGFTNDFDFYCERLTGVGAFLFLGEMQQTFLFVKVYDAVRSDVEDLFRAKGQV